MRTVDVNLANLKRKGKHIDWKGSIGSHFDFQFEDQYGLIKIEYVRTLDDGKNVVIGLSYNGKIKEFSSQKIRQGHIVRLFTDSMVAGSRNMKLTQNYKIGDIITTENNDKFQVMSVSVRIYKNKTHTIRKIFYGVKCMQCGDIFTKEQSELNRCICQVCDNKKCLPGYNDISITDSWMIPYFQGGEFEASHYTSHSLNKVIPICPYCGKIHDKPVSIAAIRKNHGFGCVCSKGRSYPEKIMYNILEQLNIDFIRECYPKVFCDDNSLKRYDFYLPKYSCIIETHGEQHYNPNCGFYIKSDITFEENSENDRIKKQLAINNGIMHYIVIDCRKSNLDWIKKSIFKSELPILLNFTKHDIDWRECAKFGQSNIARMVCDDYTNSYLFVGELADKYKLSRKTINEYLKNGNKYGWCKYENNIVNPIAVPVELYLNNKFLGYYKDKNELALELSNPLNMSKLTIKSQITIPDIGGSTFYHGYEIKRITDRAVLHRITYGY